LHVENKYLISEVDKHAYKFHINCINIVFT